MRPKVNDLSKKKSFKAQCETGVKKIKVYTD